MFPQPRIRKHERVIMLLASSITFGLSAIGSASDSDLFPRAATVDHVTRGTPSGSPPCSDLCDGRVCQPICGSTPFGGRFGTGFCTPVTTGGCDCELFECDPCGNGVADDSEQCDQGTICGGGANSGRPCIGDFECPSGRCQTFGGEGCAVNCTRETQVTTTFGGVAYAIPNLQPPITVSLAGDMTFAEGFSKNPPFPPCQPAAIRIFQPSPLPVAGRGCICVQGVADADTYGPGNVGVGVIDCADFPQTLSTQITLQSWAIPSGCEPGQPGDGLDGLPCTSDDPGRQSAPKVQAQLSLLGPCLGDCNSNQMVNVNELLTMVNIALDNTAMGACTAGDGNADGHVTVDDILGAVRRALSGCGLIGAIP
jgi:hypothetical protein